MRKIFTVLIVLFFGTIMLTAQSRIWEVSDSLVILHKNLNFNIIQNVSISCIDKNNCITFSNKGDAGAILRKTTDGGKNWEIIYVDTTILRYDVNGKLDSTTYWATEYKNFNYFENRTISFIIKKRYSTSDYYQIKSNDFGKNWDTINVFSNCNPYYYYFADGSILLKITYPNKLKKDYIYSSGIDNKFDTINIPEKFKLIFPNKILKDNDDLIISLNDDNNDSYLLRLFDNNSKYEEVKLKDIKFVDFAFSNDILYGLNSYKVDNIQKDIIYKSFDYGKTWQTVLDTNAKSLRKIEFVSKDVGIAYGYTNYNVLRTTDGGINWFNDYFGGRDSSKPFNTVEIKDVAIIDKDNMFLIVRRDPIYKLTDKIVGNIVDNDIVDNIKLLNTKNEISIQNVSENFYDSKIEIYDYIGNLIKFDKLTLNSNEIKNVNLEDFKIGIYFLKLKLNSNFTTFKFSKSE